MTNELHKHTLHLYQGDYEKLRDMHPGVPPAATIRTIIRRHIQRVEQNAKATLPEVDISL